MESKEAKLAARAGGGPEAVAISTAGAVAALEEVAIVSVSLDRNAFDVDFPNRGMELMDAAAAVDVVVNVAPVEDKGNAASEPGMGGPAAGMEDVEA